MKKSRYLNITNCVRLVLLVLCTVGLNACTNNKPHKNTAEENSAVEEAVTYEKENTTVKPDTASFTEKIDSGNLVINEFGSYSGEYVEDGSNEPVENIAAMRITNKSDRFLEFATVTVSVNGKTAIFTVTGLPAGCCAWVLESKRMVITDTADFQYIDCVTSYSESEIITQTDKLEINPDGNMLTVKNISDKTLESIAIYYRTVHSDGRYLGGITYRTAVGTLKPGEAAEVIAGHYSKDSSEIIRIDMQ